MKMKDRPPQEVLNIFWSLADFDATNRITAVSELTVKIGSHGDYCGKRLIKGLSSARAAARLGYATALTEMLSKNQITIPVEELLDLAEKELSLSGDDSTNAAIGQTLFFLSLIKSGKALSLDGVTTRIVTNLLNLKEKHQFLSCVCTYSIIQLSSQLDRHRFKHDIWPLVKSIFAGSNAKTDPNIVWLYLVLSAKFPKAFSKVNFFEDGILCDENLAICGILLLQGSSMHPVCKPLLQCALEADEKFSKFWITTIESIKSGSNKDLKLTQRICALTKLALDLELNDKQFLVVCSENFFKFVLISLIDTNSSNFLRQSFLSLFGRILEIVNSKENKDKTVLELIRRCNKAAWAFDSLTGTKIVEQLLPILSETSAKVVVEEISEHLTNKVSNLGMLDGHHMIRQLKQMFIFSHKGSIELREMILFRFGVWSLNDSKSDKFGQIDPQLQNDCCLALGNCIEHLYFLFTIKSGQTKAEFPDINRKIVVHLLTKLISCLSSETDSNQLQMAVNGLSELKSMSKFDGTTARGFASLASYCLIWTVLGESIVEFNDIMQELLSCWHNYQNPDQPTQEPKWLDVLIELMLQLMSRPDRHLRTVVQVSFSYFVSDLHLNSCQPILKVLNPTDNDGILLEDEDENIEIDGNEQLSDDENESDESDLEQNGNPDPELVNSVRIALGDAGHDLEKDEDESNGDFSDDAMMRLDESLSSAFKAHIQSKGKSGDEAKQKAEQARAFRMRCFDLLLIFVHSDPKLELTLNLMPSLVEIANGAIRTKGQSAVFEKSRLLLLTITSKSKKTADFNTSAIQDCYNKLIETSKSVTNPLLHSTIAQCISFLLSLAKQQESDVMRELKGIHQNNLSDLMQNAECIIPSAVIILPIQKHPEFFIDIIPQLADWTFSDDIRVIRKTEACRLCGAFLRKDLVTFQHKSTKKLWKKFLRKIDHGVCQIAPSVTNSLNEQSDSISLKPRFIAEVLILLKSIAGLANILKDCTTDHSFFSNISEHLKLLADAKIWRKPPLNKISSVISRSTGKYPQTLVGQIISAFSLYGDDKTSHLEEPSAKKQKTN